VSGIAIFGLSLIIIGWLEQLYRVWAHKHLSFSPFFLTLYLVGAAILAFDRFNNQDAVSGALNIVTVLLAFIILIILIVRRRKPGAF
jgi:hypothetical protein